MCGISGFNHRSEPLIDAMNRALAHRGPDHGSRYVDDRVSLGHRRLSIIDLSDQSNQPMSDPDGRFWLVYNGEVYNFQELRSELEAEGYDFRSRGDGEVVLHGYRCWGVDVLRRLNGMFAFAIYDRERKRLFLARDPFGIKPLYYYWDGDRFIFASEIKAILEHDIPRNVDAKALSEYFTFRFTLGPRTLFENIFKLPPGTYLELDLETGCIAETGAFWTPPEVSEDGASPDALAAELKELFIDSIRMRLVSDVPLGFFLSGGIDSSIVVAAAKALGADVHAFSAGFETTNELGFARLAASHFGADFREIFIGNDALERLDAMVYHMDEPVGDAAFLALMVLSAEASKQVKVVLAGEGADELFAGYDRYKAFLFGNRIAGGVPDFLRGCVPHGLGSENFKRMARVVGEREVKNRYLEIIRLFSHVELDRLGVAESTDWTSKVGVNGLFHENPLAAAQLFDLKTVLPNDFFVKADKMTSAFGLEMRVPFLDPRLVALSFRIPSSLKLRGWNEKYLLKRAFASDLPETIVRRRKHGFDVPMDAWLRGPLYEPLMGMLNEPVHELYDPKSVLSLLERFRGGSGSYKASFYDAQKLWSVLVFELWYRRFALS
jgi:asparagine synthase (glutamine-hydrolysing)